MRGSPVGPCVESEIPPKKKMVVGLLDEPYYTIKGGSTHSCPPRSLLAAGGHTARRRSVETHGLHGDGELLAAGGGAVGLEALARAATWCSCAPAQAMAATRRSSMLQSRRMAALRPSTMCRGRCRSCDASRSASATSGRASCIRTRPLLLQTATLGRKSTRHAQQR